MDITDATLIVTGINKPKNNQQMIKAWQTIINTGEILNTGGYYGQIAKNLIEQGLCKKPTIKGNK